MTLEPVLVVIGSCQKSNDRKVAGWHSAFPRTAVMFNVGVAKGLGLESLSMKRAGEELAFEYALSIVPL